MRSGIYNFLAADLSGRGDLVFKEGVFLMDYEYGNFIHHLFDMGNYYAEVISDKRTEDTLTINAMRTGKRLDLFLERITMTMPLQSPLI